ncbi:hypothetical protein ACW9UR_19160 [Halovulum sp. GXIMD14794]
MIGTLATARTLRRPDWPAVDRAMWDALIRDGGVLNPSGPLAHLRPTSLKRHEEAYGIWLGYLAALGVDLAAKPDPAARATAERVDGFIGIQSDLAPITLANRIESLAYVLEAAAPEADLAHLSKRSRRLRASAKRALRDATEDRPLPTGKALIAAARAHLANALALDGSPKRRAVAIRDAALLLVLTRHPIRRANLAALEIGRSYRIESGGHVI